MMISLTIFGFIVILILIFLFNYISKKYFDDLIKESENRENIEIETNSKYITKTINLTITDLEMNNKNNNKE